MIFGTMPDGRPVERITLTAGALRAEVLTLGAIVQDLRLQGVDRPIVLGCETVDEYLTEGRYFGAIVGRFANRIGNARFTLDGQEYRTDPNFRRRHTLHGGEDGTDLQIWQIADRADDAVTLRLSLPDGHMGFPGAIDMTACISVTADALRFDLSATADRPTPCTLTHHGYFDLDGLGNVRGHSLMVAADSYLPTDQDLIPTGEIAPLAGSDVDFRQMRVLGQRGHDLHFCLSDGPRPLRPVAWVRGRAALGLTVETTACGLQFYDGGYMTDIPGLDGRRYGPYAGLALEAQAWPDAPNRPHFPDAILRPGQTWAETTIYRLNAGGTAAGSTT